MAASREVSFRSATPHFTTPPWYYNPNTVTYNYLHKELNTTFCNCCVKSVSN